MRERLGRIRGNVLSERNGQVATLLCHLIREPCPTQDPLLMGTKLRCATVMFHVPWQVAHSDGGCP